MVAWSFFLCGRPRVKKISRSPAHLITALLRNSLPLSKSRPLTSNGISSTPAVIAARMWPWALLRMLRVNTHPVYAGEVQRAGELALERRPAVGHGVDLEEPRLGLDLIAGLADLDR